MKIVCVSGGSYKSFYLNCFVKLKRCNLLIFNFGIFYDYVVKDELLQDGLVTKEMMMLSTELGALVVVGTYLVAENTRKKVIILCNGDKLEIVEANSGAVLNLFGERFVVGDEKVRCSKFNKIIMSLNKIKPNLSHCVGGRKYVFVDNVGTSVVTNKKLKRKSQKISIFTI